MAQPVDPTLNSTITNRSSDIAIDGSLADWTANDRLDSMAKGTAQTGYELYGKYSTNSYVFAIKSAQAIGTGTTIWLNTDRDVATGYQIFGFAGGAEYNINFAADGKAYLYSGADGQNYISAVDYSISADGLSAEISVPVSLLGTTAPIAIDVLADVNNNVFLPGDYSNPAKLTVSQAGNETPTFTPKNTYGNINLDGNLTDWSSINRLDASASQQVTGYSVFGKNTADGYVLAINSTQDAIGANTTIWLNTDRDKATGYQVFGSTVGAEYNINIAADGTPYLYSGAAGQTLIGQLDFARSSDGKTLEVAIPNTIPTSNSGIDLAIDINDKAFLPGDYASNKLSIGSTDLPTRTNTTKRIAIVYSETSANNYFDKKAYSQLFTAAQSQAISAGIPFDLLAESDLKDLSKIINYDALVIPSFTNVKSADLSAIETSLTQAVTKYGIGIVTSGDFLTNDEAGAVLAGDPYSRMKSILGVQRTAGGGVQAATVTAKDVNNDILSGYTSGEQLLNYDKGIAFAAYSPIDTSSQILAEQTVNGANYNAIIATKMGGQNVHFANQTIFADSNIVAAAIDAIVYPETVTVSLDITRNNSLFLSRNDVDRSKYLAEAPTVEAKLTDILTGWNTKYGFVGTDFINIGNDPSTGEATDWTVMAPIYQSWLALGEEIGTHSYTHPFDPSNLTPTEVEFEFNQSKNVIAQQLGITVTGAATPGNPDSLTLDRQLDTYFQYYTGVGTAYNTAAGWLTPTSTAVYFSPNISFDYNAIGFLKLTNEQTAALWTQEYNQLTDRAHKPIIEFAWHDYGATGTDSAYDPAIYENFIATAAADGTEFVTFTDAQNRLRTFQKSTVTVNQVGDIITAQVTPDNSTTGVGTFSLDVQSSKQVQNVGNYYAFDNNSVFLTKTGGNFTINLGTTTDEVTHISALAQRAELLSVTGDGQNLDYTFNGAGKISIDLNSAVSQNFTATGADSYTLNGDRLEMIFARTGTHSAKVTVGSARGTSSNDLLIGGNANSTLVGVDSNSPTAGTGEIDILTHAGTSDRFILGDANQVYYNDLDSNNPGLNDYATIIGFATNSDVIQLKGTAADYTLDTAPAGVPAGTAIYANIFGTPELVGIVANTSGLSLTESYFNYV
ncbi:hypothetical protein [Chamaesiphon sp. VAR_69_metabat_338]|uniref:hypothetical protein n=1 Tax=Chamaesiphon sp. VAR_69_metabat_338 TaxID=2964704 RepID=UPI00286E1F28|nr:hypothetical protein [Chamaesiphon sp. VAR_69_metabat_338]